MYSDEELQVKNKNKWHVISPSLCKFNARWTRTKLELCTRRKRKKETKPKKNLSVARADKGTPAQGCGIGVAAGLCARV